MNTRNNSKKLPLITLLMLLMTSLFLSSCSREDSDTNPAASLIKQYELAGNYRFQISPLLGQKQVTTGTVDGTITDEGNNVLRLSFKKFRADPMPLEMSVDVQFTVTESSTGVLAIKAIENKGFFDAEPPATGINPSNNLGISVPGTALQNGMHSNGKSKISGVYNKANKQFELELDPAIQLPVVVKIISTSKLN